MAAFLLHRWRSAIGLDNVRTRLASDDIDAVCLLLKAPKKTA